MTGSRLREEPGGRNRIWNANDRWEVIDSVIHAEGVCFGLGKLGKKDRSDLLRLAESLLERIEDFDFVSEIFEVSRVGGSGFGMSFEIEHFFNEWTEVIQGSDGREREIVRIAIQAANGAENKSVFDNIERDAALVKSGGQGAVLPMDTAGGCRCLAVSGEHPPDVIVLGDVLHKRTEVQPCGSRSDGPLMLTVWQ